MMGAYVFSAKDLSSAAVVALIFAGIFLLTGLLTGCWKYFAMINSNSANHRAPFYVDTAHRASLMYAFAALLLAVFAQLSAFGDAVNTVAVLCPLVFFALAIGAYIIEGIKNRTANQLKHNPQYVFMALLMLMEIGGFVVLFAGFLTAII